jgi:hypothetical protein
LALGAGDALRLERRCHEAVDLELVELMLAMRVRVE